MQRFTNNKYKIITTGTNLFKDWTDVLIYWVKSAAKTIVRYYSDDDTVTIMIENQNDYYPQHKYKRYEGDEPPPLLETIGEKVKLNNQAKTSIYIYFLSGIHFMQSSIVTTRDGVTRKKSTKRLKRTGNLFRKNLQLNDVY